MRKMVVAVALAVVLSGCYDEELGIQPPQESVSDSDIWKESPTFMVGDHRMRGVEGKVAFQDATLTSEGQKLMWHFWGDAKELHGKFKVVALKKETHEQLNVFEGPLGGELNGAVAHAPSLVKLPEKGIWRLDIFVGEQAQTLYDSIVVQV